MRLMRLLFASAAFIVQMSMVCAGGATMPRDVSIRPGFEISCDATFRVVPSGETTIADKRGEYWLRYDRPAGSSVGSFNLYLFLDGKWRTPASLATEVQEGQTYAITAGWDGMKASIAVDGKVGRSTLCLGRSSPSKRPLCLGTKGKIDVADFRIRNDDKPVVHIGGFKTRELMPRIGAPAMLAGKVSNIGRPLDRCVLEAKAKGGAKVSPERIDVGALCEWASVPEEWKVDAGTNGMVSIGFTLRDRAGNVLGRADHTIVFMPEKDPDFSAKAWNPPISPVRTYHIDSDNGNDAHDGLTPATAWRTFANTASLTLGPGERLLLKRGCVFNGELRLSVRGSAENWAEIGAYGEGMRPQISRNRDLNERCCFLPNPAYLAVRDIVFCNAGAGLAAICHRDGSGHVLVERCLAHHIEGMYRFNAHGIPEWRDKKGPGEGCSGICLGGTRARNMVLRDCEMYQCSSGFSLGGTDSCVTRVFCHDNYAHNTSPHPYFIASRSWMTDCVFDASGWHAYFGTMGIMIGRCQGYVIRGCHFLNQPDSGSNDEGGIDFESSGENCLVDECTFRNNAGAAIEVLGFGAGQTRNIHIRRCKFDRNNWARRCGPAEVFVWGDKDTPADIACSNGIIEDNGYVESPDVPFYFNESPSTNDWNLVRNRAFAFAEDLDRALPHVDPPAMEICGEAWTDSRDVALSARVSGKASLAWEQREGPALVTFASPDSTCTKASFPAEGDYRVALKADNGKLWRTARTAVHVLPPGSCTFKAWDFSKNLDMEGWRVENAGTDYEPLPKDRCGSYPVRLVCGDYMVVAVKDAKDARIVTAGETAVGAVCNGKNVNALRIKMQNRTNSRRMRIWWQKEGGTPSWEEKNSVTFEVKPMDDGDSVYEVAMPPAGRLKQLRLDFSADGEMVSGTCRIDYIWLGRLAFAK